MESATKYLFTSQRLGFRPWFQDDLEEFAEMNADPVVMKHFPKPLDKEESVEFLNRLFKTLLYSRLLLFCRGG